MKHLAIAAALVALPALAWGQTYPFPNAPYAGEKGAGTPSTNDQILVQQGVTSHDPVGSPARMTLGTLQGLIGGLPLSGGTLTGAITAPGINSTATTGYQQNGATVLNVLSGTPYQEGVFVGPRAGAAAPWVINFGAVGVGPSALRSLTFAGSESVAVGPATCEFLTTAYANTCLGDHAIGFDNSNYITAVGNDSMRDTIGSASSTAVGAQTIRDGIGSNNTALGAFALQGNAGSITITGTPTTGDVLSVTFSTTNSNVTGLPATASYTVAGGDTLASIATGIQAAINSLNVTYTLPDGGTTWTESGVRLGAFIGSQNAPFNVVGLHFPGGPATGWAITPTASCTGTCTETLTVGGAASGADNIAIGLAALEGINLTTGNANIAIGSSAMVQAGTTASQNVCIGYQCGMKMTTDSRDTFVGFQAGNNAAGGGGVNTLIGYQAASGMTTGLFNTVIGGQNSNANCITTGGGNIEIGYGACVASPSGAWQLSIQNMIYGTGNSKSGANVSPGRIGIGTMAPNAALTIGSAGGGADDGHLGFLGTAPALTACGTTPAIDSTASDGAGTITEGTTATGCTATFSIAYSTAPHCVVSSPNGAAFTGYSTSTTALTITNASASGNKYSYVCAQ